MLNGIMQKCFDRAQGSQILIKGGIAITHDMCYLIKMNTEILYGCSRARESFIGQIRFQKRYSSERKIALK